MAALLYFEEKVHKKKLLRADAIPLLFPRLLCQILEHLGAGSPSWSRASRDSTSRAARGATTHKTPTDKRAPAPAVPSTEPTPEVAPSASPATPRPPPVIPLHQSPLLHLSLGLPYPFPSTELYVTLCRH
ncbi:hypothetical protein CK203_047045 [Vitis vinifera]|uniref:Uncharacterized protein n=1 Tax=Vitis vinifera TaxID=29760 RepID=A0A438FWN1_VITVI|nr:hypothetical protein CK203_047045 [Vitis vinifera]